MGGVVTVLAAMALLLLSPILIPVAAVLHCVHLRRKRIAARRTRCSGCGELLGIAALHLSDTEWQDYVERLRRDNLHIKFRLVRLVHAICVNCGLRYGYRDAERRFVRVESTDERGAAP